MPGSRHLVAALGFFLLAATCGTGRADAAQTVDVTLLEQGDGRMSLTTDAESVRAGRVTFDVINKSNVVEHEFLIAPLNVAPEKVPYDEATETVKEKALKGVRELGDISPGKSGTMTLELTAGKYLLFCNKPGHYKAGMYRVVTVTP